MQIIRWKRKIRLGDRAHCIQHAWIMLKSLVSHFYPKMHLTCTILRNASRLIVHRAITSELIGAFAVDVGWRNTAHSSKKMLVTPSVSTYVLFKCHRKRAVIIRLCVDSFLTTTTCLWHNLSVRSRRCIFTARCYASAVLAMALCLSVRPSVRLSVRHKSEFY